MKSHLALLLVSLAVFSLLGGVAAAQTDSLGERGIHRSVGRLEIPAGTTVEGDVSLSMGDLEIWGTVNGDASTRMGKVTVHGSVSGNVDSSMGQVIINGSVGGNVRNSIGEAAVTGTIGGDLIVDMGAVNISGTVHGDVKAGLGELRITGDVEGDVFSDGKRITISGTVGGDVNVSRGMVVLASGSVVEGRVHVQEGLVRQVEGSRAGSVQVDEELTEREVDELFRSGEGFVFRGLDDIFGIDFGIIARSFNNLRFFPVRNLHDPLRTLFWTWTFGPLRDVLNIVLFFALAVLVFTLFPRQVRTVVTALEKQTGTVLLWGIVAALLAIPLMILLLITIVGTPLLILVYAVAWVLGYTGLTLLLGGRLLQAMSPGSNVPLIEIAIGASLLGLTGMIPLIGLLVKMAVFIAAVGAALCTRFGTLEK